MSLMLEIKTLAFGLEPGLTNLCPVLGTSTPNVLIPTFQRLRVTNPLATATIMDSKYAPKDAFRKVCRSWLGTPGPRQSLILKVPRPVLSFPTCRIIETDELTEVCGLRTHAIVS